MNIIRTFLSTALNIELADVHGFVCAKLECSPFHESLLGQMDALFTASDTVQDDLWKFSVVLDIPHQLLCDSFALQQQINRTFQFQQKVV